MAEIRQIDSHTWSFEDTYVRFFLLEGDDQAVLIDSGVACPDALELAKTLTDKPIILLNTHGDGDHLSGTVLFSEIHMHELDFVNCKVGSRFPGVSLVPVDDGDMIDLGGRPLRMIHIPGHTKGSLAILDVTNRVLYGGDSVQKGHIFMFGAHRDTEQYESSLDKLIAMKDEFDHIYASHDELVLDNDYTEKVKSAWQLVRQGKVPYEMTELHGTNVKSYTTDVCGFYID